MHVSKKDLSKIKSPLDSILTREVVMKIGEVLAEGGVCEVGVGYTAKLEGYAKLGLDISCYMTMRLKLRIHVGYRFPNIEKIRELENV